MSTIVYKNARAFINDADIAAQLTELAVEYSAEILDETTYGDDTRVHKGGLKMGKISGKGWFDDAYAALGLQNVESLTFGLVGTDDIVISVFPDSITEGSQSGYAMKGVLSEFKIGDPVGTVLSLSFSAESRGIAA